MQNFDLFKERGKCLVAKKIQGFKIIIGDGFTECPTIYTYWDGCGNFNMQCVFRGLQLSAQRTFVLQWIM